MEHDAREWLATQGPTRRAGEGLPLGIVAPTGDVLLRSHTDPS